MSFSTQALAMIRTARARLAMEPLEDRLAPATFTVSTAEDAGPGSLRRAIHLANATPGLDMIAFAIPGDGVHTINVQSALPAITDPLAVGGQTQPGYQGQPLIELNGTNAGIGVQGLAIERGGSGSVIRALAINRFAMPGPLFEERGADGIRILADHCLVKGCFLGTDPTGTIDLGNARHGVFITGGASQSRIWGKASGTGNVIVHNGGAGVLIGSNHGEGRRFLGATTVTTGPAENTVEFAKLLPVVSPGRFITATATDALGNTSEISLALFLQ